MGELNSQLGRRVYLDTNIIIYAVEGYETHAESEEQWAVSSGQQDSYE
jgi:predicted nucleic acid-binding protein